MPKLIAYRKIVDDVTTHTLRLPHTAGSEPTGQELASLPDGRTVVVLADGHDLPADQAEAIAGSIELLPSPLPDELRETIKAHSPQLRLIAAQMIEQIRSLYSVDDEMYYARLGVGAAMGIYTPTPKELAELGNFGAFVEGVRDWGRQQRARFGV